MGQEWELSGLSALPDSQLQPSPSPSPAPFWLREALSDSNDRCRLLRQMRDVGWVESFASSVFTEDLAWLSRALSEGRLSIKQIPALVIKAGSPPRKPEAEIEPEAWEEVEAPPEDNSSPEVEPTMAPQTAKAISEKLKSMSEQGTPFLLLCDNGQENCEECAAHAGVC